jgi:hypothetical protein
MNPEDPQSAQRIVAEFATLLEEHAQQDIYPARASALPYSKDTIRVAIETSLLTLADTRQLTPELRDFLYVAYVALADYVDDEVARLMTEFRRASAALEADTREKAEKTASPAWRTVAESSALAGRIAREMADEAGRLGDAFKSLEARAPTAEV